jgi:ABC-type dipeptide/oligopeptide/nickel transport system permease component
MSLTLVGISVPAFVTAAVLLLVFIAKLGWFGLGGVPDFDSAGLLVMLSLVLVAGGMALAFTEVLWLAALAAGAAFLWGLAFVYPVLSFETFGLTLALLLVIAALKVDAEWLKRTLAGVAMAVVVALVVGLVSALPAFDGLQNLLLPAVALSLAPMAYIVRLQRVSMLDVLGADYVRTARAKGLSKPRVVIKHCLRNAFLPVFTYLGPAAAVTLTGSFVVERVFNIPGMGQMFVDSVTNRDQTLILALVMVYSALVLSFNLLVDLGYAFIDPRIDVTAGR